MEIVLANPRGFCAGVDRAIAIVNRALECFNPPIYVRHEVVHNKFVVDDLRQRGAIGHADDAADVIRVVELDAVGIDSRLIVGAIGRASSHLGEEGKNGEE